MFIDDFLGTFPDHITESVSKKALANWYTLNVVLAAYHWDGLTNSQLECTRKSLCKRTTVWHRHAFRLLYKWWTASYQDPAIALVGILDIVDRCGRLDEEGASNEHWRYVMKFLEL